MKYIFFGTPRFASIVLAELMKDMPPMAVVANPDRPAGRKKTLTPPPVKVFLRERKSPEETFETELLQPEKLSEIAPALKAMQPDLFVVAAYGKIIPQSVLDIPRLGTVGVHPSLLPRYRGATPIQSAILAGEEKTGLTLYLMDTQVDHGPILASSEIEIGNMDYLELEAALAGVGGRLLKETLPKISRGEIQPRIQDESQANLVGKFETGDAFIPWAELESAAGGDGIQNVLAVWRKIRAFNPEPGAWTIKGDVRIKLLRADVSDGVLMLRKIQRAGKNPENISGKLP